MYTKRFISYNISSWYDHKITQHFKMTLMLTTRQFQLTKTNLQICQVFYIYFLNFKFSRSIENNCFPIFRVFEKWYKYSHIISTVYAQTVFISFMYLHWLFEGWYFLLLYNLANDMFRCLCSDFLFSVSEQSYDNWPISLNKF